MSDTEQIPGEEPSGGPWVGMAVELVTAEGPLRGRVQVFTGPMRLAELVTSAQELTDVVAGRAARAVQRGGGQISCRAGCGACCRQMVPISPPEAFYIAEMLDELPPERRERVAERFARIESRLAEEAMLEAICDVQVLQAPAVDLTRAVNRRYFLLGMSCPFLEDESCSIHPLRPVACREYSVTTPAAWCADPFRNPLQLVSMPLPLSVALARLTAELTGEKPVLIPLSLVPLWVKERQELRRRTWPGLDLFRRFLELAGPPPAETARPAEEGPEANAPEAGTA